MVDTMFTRPAAAFETPGLPIRAARTIALASAARIRWGTLTLAEDGTQRSFGYGEPAAHVRIHDPRTYTALLGRGSVGMGQSYIDGWWDCDDLTALVRILIRNTNGISRLTDRVGRMSRFADPVRQIRRGHKNIDRRNVRAHYDLGNELFEIMLDETMAYSCAVFERDDATLLEASTAKLDRICRKLALGPDDHVVEIGTGWGGLAVHAATRYGCRVTTTTVSEQQYEYARKRVADAGLADRVTVLDADYRDLEGSYDKLVSIEMIEAVDWRDLDTFFAACSRLLHDDGLMALQAIVIGDAKYDRAKHAEDFIKRFVFPGGCLPSVGAINRSTARATDLRVLDLEDIGRHYAETLRRWRANLHAREDEVERLRLGRAFRRMWELYLCYCEGGFLEGNVSAVQMVLAKPSRRPPLATRTL